MTLTAEALAQTLASRLAAALDRVFVRVDGLAVAVAGRSLSADSSRDLRGWLSNALYEEFHVGNGAHRREADTSPRRSLCDVGLEGRLAAGVSHVTTLVRGWLIEVLRWSDIEHSVVRLSEITARVLADRLLTFGLCEPGQLVDLALEASCLALSLGFFYVMGSRALLSSLGFVRRLFLHATDTDGAVRLWVAALRALERTGARYHAKALSDSDDFSRRDGIVIYLHGRHEEAEAAVVEAVAGLGVGESTSLFTRQLALGVAAAWDSQDSRSGHGGMSFGQHRSFALATALVDHATSEHFILDHATSDHATTDGGSLDGGSLDGGSLEERVARAFTEAGIDPLHPENNLTANEGSRDDDRDR